MVNGLLNLSDDSLCQFGSVTRIWWCESMTEWLTLDEDNCLDHLPNDNDDDIQN